MCHHSRHICYISSEWSVILWERVPAFLVTINVWWNFIFQLLYSDCAVLTVYMFIFKSGCPGLLVTVLWIQDADDAFVAVCCKSAIKFMSVKLMDTPLGFWDCGLNWCFIWLKVRLIYWFVGISSSSMSLRWQRSSSRVNQPCHWRHAARLNSL